MTARQSHTDTSAANHVSTARPVIMLGRGGGGTRLLSEFVAGQGVFLGSKLNKSFDSVEWVDTIYAIAIDVLSTEGPPDSVRYESYIKKLHDTAARVLGQAGLNPLAYWGWKLPETTLICDIVKSAFPQASFLHLVRHPVSASLRRSHMTSRMNNPMGAAALPAAYVHGGRDPALIDTDEVYLHNAYSWLHQADLMVQTFGDEPALHTVQFEQMCANPEKTALELARFLPRTAPDDAPKLVVDPDRASAIEMDQDQARRIWGICGARATGFGYSLAQVLD